MRRMIVIGAGGHARSIADIVLEDGEYALVGLVDDAYPDLESVWEFPVLGKVNAATGLRGLAE